jgi:sRNA-binding carbon storage regulator CsrA
MGWLALDLKPNESVHIGPNTKVCLVRQKGPGAVVAILAPPTVRILRDELFARDTRPFANGDAYAGLFDLLSQARAFIPATDDRLEHAAEARRILDRLLEEIRAAQTLTRIDATLQTPAPPTTQATP